MSERETVAVLAPLREELAPLLRRLGSRRPLVSWTGDGWRAAREGLESLLAEHDVSRLVVLGVAGGLTPGLGVGDIAVAREVRDGDGVAPAPAWVDVPGARPAVFLTQRRIAVTAAEKAELGSRLAGDGGLEAVVDLETAVYARVAAAHGVPYTAIRAVSDTVDEDLPLDFNRFLDAGGGTRRARVALYALGRPWLLGRLLGLRSRLRLCGERLSDAALLVLQGDSKHPV